MSFLIIGGSENQQQQKAYGLLADKNINTNSNPDLVEVYPDKSIGIDEIRDIKSFLNKKSWQSNSMKTVIIYGGEQMTTPAQNAFLKTLEEPPPNSLIILAASAKNALLPTIISRCQIIRLAANIKSSQKVLNKSWKKWQSLINAKVDERLNLAGKIKEKDLDKYITVLQKKIVDKKTDKASISQWLENLITTKQMIEDNVNVRHAVDWLVLKL